MAQHDSEMKEDKKYKSAQAIFAYMKGKYVCRILQKINAVVLNHDLSVSYVCNYIVCIWQVFAPDRPAGRICSPAEDCSWIVQGVAW